ncbi:MAG: sigma-70 family RNA polymerase sigma factor [Candidatus Gastranaerophilales bacterium]|nr:sigma-70 family RNA polymerase sigma factor [Candidatus Gastranaerophilales bacterium]
MTDYKDKSLIELVKLAQQNDKKALEELIRQEQSSIYKYFNAQKTKADDLPDLTQEVFLKMTKSIKSLKNPLLFKSWLNRIVNNVFLDFLRKKQRQSKFHSVFLPESIGALQEVPDTDKTPIEFSLAEELKGKIEIAIQDLPVKLKDMLILRELKGLSYEKIASKEKININTVKSRLSRARSKLKEDLNNYLD